MLFTSICVVVGGRIVDRDDHSILAFLVYAQPFRDVLAYLLHVESIQILHGMLISLEQCEHIFAGRGFDKDVEG